MWLGLETFEGFYSVFNWDIFWKVGFCDLFRGLFGILS